MASLYDSYGFPVLEKGDDVNSDLPISEQQVEHQRPKWAAFIKTRGGISSEKEPWLWKYWKTGSRTTSQITKKFLGMVGSLGIPSNSCLLYTSPSPRDLSTSRMPSSA